MDCQRCSGVTKFYQVDNKASNRAFGKSIFQSMLFCIHYNVMIRKCMGTEIRLLLGTQMIRNAITD